MTQEAPTKKIDFRPVEARDFTDLDATKIPAMPDKELRDRIIEMRRRHEYLDTKQNVYLDELILEYTSRGKAEFQYFDYKGDFDDREIQQWIWGEVQEGTAETLEGFTKGKEGKLEVDTDSDVAGKLYWLTARQLQRTIEYYKPKYKLGDAYIDERKVHVILPKAEVAE